MDGFALIVLPDPEDPQAALICVEGRVAGHPQRFLLDTGAARSCVATDGLTATLPSLGTALSTGLFGTTTEDLVVVPTLAIGPLVRRAVTVARAPVGAHPLGGALLGLDVLAPHRLHLHFSLGWVAVDPPTVPPGPHHPLARDRAGHLVVPVRLRETDVPAVLDTGAGITLVDQRLARRHPAHFHPASQATGTDATGASQETPIFVLTGAVIGGRRFPPHPVAGVDLRGVDSGGAGPLGFILGASTLVRADWWLDGAGQRWAVTQLDEST